MLRLSSSLINLNAFVPWLRIRSLNLRTVSAIASLEFSVGAYAARIDVSVIKFFVANVLQQVLDRAIQAHGGLGMCDDLPLAFWFRHERAARIYDGADEVHKERVAKYILKDYLPDAKKSHG